MDIKDMKNVIDESFRVYAGAVAQSRAFVDARDCLKPSTRQIFYCLETDKFLPTKPFKKTLKAIGSIARMYIHGDASAEGIIMRSSQEFAMRYPLIEVEGNNGNLMKSGNWAAPRYTASRLSPLTVKLFEDVDKNTIAEWRDNYDDTEQYPSVLPSKGFYNIVNGTSGIGVGVASSIPQFNIKDVNAALEILLLNPDATFEELYCPPDFATGAFLINEEEVKNALKYGSKKVAKMNNENGASCKLRAKMDYNEKENCIVVTEIPYSVYTNTICQQLEDIINDDELNPGIDRFNDLTGSAPNIKIYLKKGVAPGTVMNRLYKLTSLQYHYAINMTMLDNGRTPKVFTWKEALQSHINHEIEVYTRGYQFDLKKIKDKIHILDGLLICIANIDEVISLIKNSSSTIDAKKNLIDKYNLDEEQAKAVLDMKLAKLAKLEIETIKSDREKLIADAAAIEKILGDKDLFNNELIKAWRDIANKYGDEHRTKIITVAETPEEKEIEAVVPEDVVVIVSQSGSIKRVPVSSFKTQRRNGKGVKSEDKVILETISTNTIDTLMIFTDKGKMYRLLVDNVPNADVYISSLVKMEGNEKVIAVTSLHRKSKAKFVLFVTKQGMIKKTAIEEYMTGKRTTGIVAIKLKDGDSIANVTFINDEDLILVSKKGMGIRFETKDIAPIGRATSGVKSIKLSDGDEVLVGLPVHKESDKLAVFTSKGYGKKIVLDELPTQGRVGRGVTLHKPSNIYGDLVGAAMVCDDDNVLVIGKPNSICFCSKEMSTVGRQSAGSMLIKNSVVNKIIKL